MTATGGTERWWRWLKDFEADHRTVTAAKITDRTPDIDHREITE